MVSSTTAGFGGRSQPSAKSFQLAVLQMVLVLLSLALWVGWADENAFLDRHIASTQALIASNPHNNDLITAGPAAGLTHGQYAVQIEEKEFHYLERQAGQHWKLIPLTLWTLFVAYLFYSKEAKAKAEFYLASLFIKERSETFARMVAVIVGLASILPAYLINGHAQSGGGIALILGLYTYWFLKPAKVTAKTLSTPVKDQDQEIGT
jgi:hypothetical protein